MNEDDKTLEDLLDPNQPSGLERRDAAFQAAGVSVGDLRATKDAIGAIALGTVVEEAPPPSVRDRIVASHERKGKYGIFADRVARLFELPITEAERLLAHIEDPAVWKPFLVEGVDLIPVDTKVDNAIATLVRIAPGVSFPQHTHRGTETMFVLEGGFVEPATNSHLGNENQVWRGEEIHRVDGSEHRLIGLPGVPCVAAVIIRGHADFA